jgi:predicted Ser/Thr protein kinase
MELQKLGNRGSEATTYLLRRGNTDFAIKKFHEKSPKGIYKEGLLQTMGWNGGVSPKVFEIRKDSLVMEKMDTSFIEYLRDNSGYIHPELQHRIISIINRLDDLGVYHNDPNPCNFMFRNGELYIIDYGYSELITEEMIKKFGTKNMNTSFMLIGLVLRIRELFKDNTLTYPILNKKINIIYKNFH